ncbi:adenosylcobinamide-GDP ribazoletransferase [Oceaniglobus indicus]|uniref:adenosylcobinamide-GDP ribazoletransferase n=1 Tax=Oceaniglobus indicus TaxID=2047749 RepID=UPI000C17619E|nr:adenosylcobinamide-GDP ribazoletransferase [Oceaniglobus indicus]
MPDKTDLPRAGDLLAALGLLTRLPLPAAAHGHGQRGARAAWAWPVAGAVVGTLSGAIGALGMQVGISATFAAGLTLATSAAMTGALHEDGLADTVDGFWGGSTPERRLAIMKDSQIGSYGTIALIVSFGLRWSALATLFTLGAGWVAVIAAGALSRAPMAFVSRHLASARPGGLSVLVGRPSARAALLGALLALTVALVCTGVAAFVALAVIALTTWALAKLARRRIGGQTGDVLGAAQQLAEIGALGVFAAMLGG